MMSYLCTGGGSKLSKRACHLLGLLRKMADGQCNLSAKPLATPTKTDWNL